MAARGRLLPRSLLPRFRKDCVNWPVIETFFVQALIAIVLNGVLAIFIWRKKKKDDLPEDFAVFKARMERMLAEREHDHSDVAGAVLRLQSDMIGVRESVQWIKGRINGKGWQQP